MTDLKSDEQLIIAKAGEQFDETESHSWNSIKIRKGDRIGKVIRDTNGLRRILTVEFDDENKEEIRMNNVGPDLEYIHDYEWFEENGQKWYKF